MARASLTWLLESDVFPNGDCLRSAAANAGQRVIDWSDEWWSDGSWPAIDQSVLFHGSLGNADRIAELTRWSPGAYCRTTTFLCSNWYREAAKWLVHEQWEILPASRFVGEAEEVLERVGAKEAIFVRPDSPLKPFSGRVLQREKVSLAALDHGFYYDNADIEVVVAPVQQIQGEWRFVVIEREVVTGSGYVANGRLATLDQANDGVWRFAAEIAAELAPPEAVYVMDVCETENGLRLLELNPFSGADLYACDGDKIVRRIAEIV